MIANRQFYPWQQKHRDRLMGLKAMDKLPHALLLSGPAHLGKRDFAIAMAGYLLCRQPTGDGGCGECDNCRLLAAGTHPDFRMIEPEDSRLIKIEQVRELIDWANQTAQRDGYKVVIVHPAEQMNVHSANALLKCLEEPADDTLMMLVSDLPGRLLPTIRSRCQHVDFTIPGAGEALAWLRQHKPETEALELLLDIAGGAPLAVVEQFDEAYLARRESVVQALDKLMQRGNPLEVARAFNGMDAAEGLEILHSLFADALRYRMTNDVKTIKNKDLLSVLEKISSTSGSRGLLAVLDGIARDRQAVAGPSNPNVQLLFEALMVEISDGCAL